MTPLKGYYGEPSSQLVFLWSSFSGGYQIGLDGRASRNCLLYVREEHPDNIRFKNDCEKWFGQEIKVISNEKYNGSIYEVFEKRNYLVGVAGAPCTRLLKKEIRKETMYIYIILHMLFIEIQNDTLCDSIIQSVI